MARGGGDGVGGRGEGREEEDEEEEEEGERLGVAGGWRSNKRGRRGSMDREKGAFRFLSPSARR